MLLSKEFRDEAVKRLEADPAMKGADLSRFKNAAEPAELAQAIADGALPLESGGATLGCIKSAHPSDVNLGAHAMLENLSAKATAVYALRDLVARTGIDAKSIDYVIETSEEACGDQNQRGGGNFAKAIGELCGLANATGSDVRSFCAGPVHGLLQAASHIRAGSFRRVVVVAGGATAKLAMNAKKHLEKGLPALEDCLGAFAVLLDGEADAGLLVRNDLAGTLRIGSGSSPQAVVQDLVADPLARAGLRFADVDCYAPELQNPEITEAAGAGNVTLANHKMIAALAVMKKEIAREEMDAFIARHGVSGWAPTQGHIPSGIPALGWFLAWSRAGKLHRGMLIGKGSLFLGRMTGLFDGVSLLVEAWKRGADAAAAAPAAALPAAAKRLRVGLTIPGSEGGGGELSRGAEAAAGLDATVEPVLFGSDGGDPGQAHREMERALAAGDIQAAVTFHYPFPIGIATVGHLKAPGSGRDLFIATTTGTASADRVEALVLNAIAGVADGEGVRDRGPVRRVPEPRRRRARTEDCARPRGERVRDPPRVLGARGQPAARQRRARGGGGRARLRLAHGQRDREDAGRVRDGRADRGGGVGLRPGRRPRRRARGDHLARDRRPGRRERDPADGEDGAGRPRSHLRRRAGARRAGRARRAARGYVDGRRGRGHGGRRPGEKGRAPRDRRGGRAADRRGDRAARLPRHLRRAGHGVHGTRGPGGRRGRGRGGGGARGRPSDLGGDMGTRFAFDFEKCTECRRCMADCAVVKTGVVRMADSRIDIIRSWPELPEIRVCRFDDCAGHPCIADCPVEAISENGGVVAIDREACTGCELCVAACPYHAIRMNNGTAMKCDFCGGDPACVKACVTAAIAKGGA